MDIDENPETIAPWTAKELLLAELANFEYMSAVKANGVGPDALMKLRDNGLRLVNVPACLGGSRVEEGAHYELSRDLVDAQGNLGVTPYVQRYIEGEYYKKSLRCKGCALYETCRGMHISYLRAHGFGVLKPIASPSEEKAA